MNSDYDVIVVGARCAGSSTALLLARLGYRVLVVDRAKLPSDTLSGHAIHPAGLAILQRWGLLDRVRSAGAPPMRVQHFDVGPFRLTGTPVAADGISELYCVRRTVLDTLLLEEAAAAGADVRQGFTVKDLVWEGDRVIGIRGHGRSGPDVTARAAVVLGRRREALCRRPVGRRPHLPRRPFPHVQRLQLLERSRPRGRLALPARRPLRRCRRHQRRAHHRELDLAHRRGAGGTC